MKTKLFLGIHYMFIMAMLITAVGYLIGLNIFILSFQKLGYPNYFRIIIGSFKFLGSLSLIVPNVATRLKEWSYAGFTFTLLGAVFSHLSIGDGFDLVFPPILMLLFLAISFFYYQKASINFGDLK